MRTYGVRIWTHNGLAKTARSSRLRLARAAVHGAGLVERFLYLCRCNSVCRCLPVVRCNGGTLLPFAGRLAGHHECYWECHAPLRSHARCARACQAPRVIPHGGMVLQPPRFLWWLVCDILYAVEYGKRAHCLHCEP